MIEIDFFYWEFILWKRNMREIEQTMRENMGIVMSGDTRQKLFMKECNRLLKIGKISLCINKALANAHFKDQKL